MMQCAECKGKGMCGLPRCPIVSRFHAQVASKPSSSYQGSSPSVFIGSFGYPGCAGRPAPHQRYGSIPRNGSGTTSGWRRSWASAPAPSAGIPAFPGSPAACRRSHSPRMPLDVDVAFEKPVEFSLNFDGTVAPVGFSGTVKTMDLIGSAKVGRAVDRITSDTDIVATDAAIALNSDGVDVYQIAKLMTAGLLGKRRKFVPTRWAITAVDDTLSNGLKKEIARFPPLEEILVFSGEIYGNRIVAILLPGDWKYEMIEVWGKHTLWAGDDEVIVQDREGMTKHGYSPISGAYYSARLAVCEYLKTIRRSARVVVVRSDIE